MKTMNKILAVSIIAMMAVPAAHAKIVSETMLTKTAGTYSGTNTVEMAIADAKQAGTDAATAAAAAQTTANAALPTATYNTQVGTVNATNMGTTAGTVVGAIKELKTAITTAGTNASDTYATKTALSEGLALKQNASDSNVTGTTNYLTAGNGVAGNLKALDTKVKSNADAIAGKQASITSSAKLSADLVDDTSTTHKFVSTTEKNTWNAKQDALGYTAENSGNKVKATTNITEEQKESTDLYPSMATTQAMIDSSKGTLTAQISGKQPKSTDNYQMGKSGGGWQTMSDAQQGALNSGATTENIGQASQREIDDRINQEPRTPIAIKE